MNRIRGGALTFLQDLSPDRRDALLLGGLMAALTLIVLYVGLRSPGPVIFAADQVPANVILHTVLEPERDGATPFRWTKPHALIGVPVGGPARYQLALRLSAGTDAPGRTVRVTINGRDLGVVALGAAWRDYLYTYDFTPGAWASAPQGALSIVLDAEPTVPPGEERTVGVRVATVGVTPLFAARPLLRPNWALLALPALGLLALVYAALRLGGVRRGLLGLGLGFVLLGCALLAALARGDALALAYQPVAQVAPFAILLAAIAAAPWAARSAR